LQYPLLELGTGILFLAIWLSPEVSRGLTSGQLVASFIFWYLLFLASIYDLRHKILPDEFIYGAGLAALIYGLTMSFNFKGLAMSFNSLKTDFLTAFIVFLFFAGLWLFSKGKAMGFGDAKMAGALGLFLGFPKIAPALIFSFWSGALAGLFLIIFKKARLKSAVPFGPFLFLGGFSAWLLNVVFLENLFILW
jgi:leader peptidase (prepilin peptidase)/N-methyltransferase